MNRIYQGKVAAVEIADGESEADGIKWKALDGWSTLLWQHHELFHDAVNYYTLALAALTEGVQADSAKGKAAIAWRDQVRENWLDGRRRALRYEGPHRRLATLLRVGINMTDKDAAFNACAKAVLLPNGSSPVQRAAAVLQLLEEAAKTDLSQLSVSRLPFLASGKGKHDGTSKAVSSLQEVARQKLAREFRDLPDREAIKRAPELDLGLFLTTAPLEKVSGKEAAKMLMAYWNKAAEKLPNLASTKKKFFAAVSHAEADLSIPVLGRKPSGLYPIAAVFRFFPCAETLAAFRDATRSLCQAKDKSVTTDALAEVRVGDLPVFDYFTNLVFHRDANDTRRAAWFEFDLAAFIEAIKAPHRYFQDTQKREAEADKLRAVVAGIEGQGRKEAVDDEDSRPTFGFAEDPRIDLLHELVNDSENGLAYLAEGDGSEAKEYTIQERTLRGWNTIRDKWCALAEKGDLSPEKLWSVVTAEQAAHRDDFGSAALYKKLAEPRYRPIWRDKGTKAWHAEDTLRAWLEYTETRFELLDKERPIRFTPAHAIHSPRYFIFPKGGPWGSKHESGSLAFTAGIGVREDSGRWRLRKMRFHYSAPRLRRDELRGSDEKGLESVPWLQPMMKALGLPEPARQNFGNCRITLQPTGPDDIQLTFPVEIDSSTIVAHIGKQSLWARQFNVTPDGEEFRDATLRWPHEKQPSKPIVPWHEARDSFYCLSVDLGQRDAGAYALLDVRAHDDFGGKPSRFIGETPDKTWRAALAASGMFQLSGEDRREWRARTAKDLVGGSAFAFREELHGSRGRMPRPEETDDCRAMAEAFLGKDGAGVFLPEGWDDPRSPSYLSFPEQNDKLLIAARRAQSRAARLHRWCWFLGDEKKRMTALDEIRDAFKTEAETGEQWLPATLQSFTVADNDPRLLYELRGLLETRLKELPGLLVRLANRVLPLRGRSWHWGAHPEATKENRVFLLTQKGPALDTEERRTWLRGQRGMSMARIEQIEELRRRFQSLNQTLRRDIGGNPPIRRDETVPDPCPDLLDKLDRMKRQRVNQTAHMILAEALGVRLTVPPANKAVLKAERDQHGVYQKVREPVDFIVIEDLSRYRASQGRAPRENSRLMKWCHRQVRDKLRELCEPFGIPVLETPAAYSSRFCSRTGVPGFRAVEVAAGFENEAPWRWLKDKQSNGNLTDEAMFIRRTAGELYSAQSELESIWTPSRPGQPAPKRTLLLPQAGGPIFVPVCEFDGGEKLRAAIVQADVNAAINLGLRAIADPRLWTIHPRLRTERAGSDVRKGKKATPKQIVSESDNSDRVVRLKAREKRKYGANGPLLDLGVSAHAGAIKDTRNPNYFFDVAAIATWDRASVPDPCTGELVSISSGKALWKTVKERQWVRCGEINDARLRRWKHRHLEKSDVPF